MKKRFLSVLLAVVLCLGLTPAALADTVTYSDVSDDYWFAPVVYRATELGIFKGVGDGLFGCGQPITRAAFVTALVRLFGWETVERDEATFADVQKGTWYFNAVETAAANGVIPAVSGTFRPDEELKRGDMAAMMIRALGYAPLAGAVSGFDCPFTDVVTNRGFITMAYDMGLVSGHGDGRFTPDEFATREQAAAVIVRLYDRLYAQSAAAEEIGERPVVTVETPAAAEGASLPTTPLEPIAELYEVLRGMKESGQNMSDAVLVLCAGGVCTILSETGEIIDSSEVSDLQVKADLMRPDVRIYYSERFESAYCIYMPNYYQTATLWYQSERSLAVKLQLARMFGVTDYILR